MDLRSGLLGGQRSLPMNDSGTIVESVDGYVVWLNLAGNVQLLPKTLFPYLSATGSTSSMHWA